MKVSAGSIGRSDLHVALHAGHEEIKAVKGCEELEYLDLAFSWSEVVDVNVDRLWGGSAAKVFCQPGVSIRSSFCDVVSR